MTLVRPVGRASFFARVFFVHNLMIVLPIPEPWQPFHLFSSLTRAGFTALLLAAWLIGVMGRLMDIKVSIWLAIPWFLVVAVTWFECVFRIRQPDGTIVALAATFATQFPLMTLRSRR